jgi:hypothetical protein
MIWKIFFVHGCERSEFSVWVKWQLCTICNKTQNTRLPYFSPFQWSLDGEHWLQGYYTSVLSSDPWRENTDYKTTILQSFPVIPGWRTLITRLPYFSPFQWSLENTAYCMILLKWWNSVELREDTNSSPGKTLTVRCWVIFSIEVCQRLLQWWWHFLGTTSLHLWNNKWLLEVSRCKNVVKSSAA